MAINKAPALSDAPGAPDIVGTSNTPARVAVIGCGGFGINIARILKNKYSDLIVDAIGLDTSKSNVRTDDTIDVHIVAGGVGAGKIRGKHSDEIKKNLTQMTFADADVYIVPFGLSGGSGSVVGPLALKHLSRTGKRVVAVTTDDTLSEIDSENTKNALRTLEAISDQNDLYLPVILTSNTKLGRTEADRAVLQQTGILIHLLAQPTSEVDLNDRLTFLNPSETKLVDVGLRMLYLEEADHTAPRLPELADDSYIADSVLSLGTLSDDGVSTFLVNVGRRARWRKEGVLSRRSPVGPIIGVIMNSSEPLEKILSSVSESKDLFGSQKKKRKTLFNDLDDDDDVIC